MLFRITHRIEAAKDFQGPNLSNWPKSCRAMLVSTQRTAIFSLGLRVIAVNRQNSVCVSTHKKRKAEKQEVCPFLSFTRRGERIYALNSNLNSNYSQ